VTISGNAGAGGVTLRYIDIVIKTITSASNGTYSATIPYGWSGTITPSKSGVTFDPTSRTYNNVTANITAQNYSPTVTFKSTGSQDGWILESTETSNKGGTMNNVSTLLYIGDDYKNRQYRAILSFNTAAIPDNAVITRVTLKIRLQGVTGKNPFTTHGNLLLDVRKGGFSSKAALQLNDFQAIASRSVVSTIPKTPVGSWYTRAWTSGIFTYINKRGITQFRLRFGKDDNNDKGADYLKLYSGNAGASYQPQLIIKYRVP
jgi:hypothetical protein